MNKKYINNKGITLIALVVTIIVLIILAAVSINLVLGENGLITRAKEQSKEYETDQILETLELKKAEMVMSKHGGVLSVKEFTDNIKSDANIHITNVEEVDTNTANITVDGKYIFSVVKEANGNLKIVFGSEDETIPEQPEQNKKLTDVAKPGDYVEYYSVFMGQKSSKIICRVLYNDSTYGLQIIRDGVTSNTSFGGDTFDSAESSYNSAVSGALGYAAAQFSNTGDYSKSTRIVGSNPITGAIGENNDDYLIDYNTMVTLGIHNVGSEYWLAAKGKETIGDFERLYVHYVSEQGNANMVKDLIGVYTTAGTNYRRATGEQNAYMRQVAILKPDVLVGIGNGSSSSPYTLVAPQ